MHKNLSISIVIAIALLSFSFYSPTLDEKTASSDVEIQGERYLEEVFKEFSVKTVTYLKSGDEKFEMDVYEPKGDKVMDRPVVLYVHGGGFVGGQRDEKRYTDFCEEMARKGYVTITMSYKLLLKGQSFDCELPAREKVRVFAETASYMHAATKYIQENARSLKVDSKNITLAGSSAGAEAVLHAVYYPHDGRYIQKTYEYAGVISMAGALIDDQLISKESAIPTQLFHGTCDDLVPYATAAHHYCNDDTAGALKLFGGKSIADRLGEIGQGFYMITGCNGGHEWNDLPMKSYSHLITDFIYHDVLKGETRQIHVIEKSDREACAGRGELAACDQL